MKKSIKSFKKHLSAGVSRVQRENGLQKMLGRKHSLKGGEQIVLADYGPDEVTNTENQDLEWVNKVSDVITCN